MRAYVIPTVGGILNLGAIIKIKISPVVEMTLGYLFFSKMRTAKSPLECERHDFFIWGAGFCPELLNGRLNIRSPPLIVSKLIDAPYIRLSINLF